MAQRFGLQARAEVGDIATDIRAYSLEALAAALKPGDIAVSMLPAWLDAPDDVTAEGFWATLDWWLEHTEDFVHRDPVPNRIAVIGRWPM